MGYALLFSGQGAQHPAMLPWLGPGERLADVDRRLGGDWRERLADPAWAGDNANAQVLLTGLALAAWTQLAPHLPPPAIVAGYSVGELAAFAAAGALEPAAAVELAAQRARCMDAAAEAAGVPTGLLGVGGGTPASLAGLAARFDLDVAIRLGPGSAVLGGPRSALAAAADAAVADGWRCTPLNIAVASHTRWMAPAAEAFAPALAAVGLRAPRGALVSNALGRVRDAAQAEQALRTQLARTVAWDECMEAVAAQRVDAVLEIGPGQALARGWHERCAHPPARSADEFRSAAAVVAWVRRMIASGGA